MSSAAVGGAMLPPQTVQVLQAQHKQARLLSKQFLHESAVAVAGTSVSMTHSLSDPSCVHVGYYLEA